MNDATHVTFAAALGGHLLHVIVIGGALLLAAVVYCAATFTAPPAAGRPPARRLPDIPRAPQARRSAAAQQVAFLGLCAAAGAHLAVMPDHFQQSWMYGAFFAVVAPLQVAIAWMILVRARRAELTAALTFSLTIVVLWAVTRLVGVPIGPDNGGTEAPGVLDIFATSCELLTSAALLYLLRTGRRGTRSGLVAVWRWSLWSPLTRTVLAATCLGVPLLSLFASRS